MNTDITNSLRELLRELPDAGVERDLAVRRVIETYAAIESVGALKAAAARAREAARDAGSTGSPRETPDAVADVLFAASVLWQDGDGVLSAEKARAREVLRTELASRTFVELIPIWIAELREIAGAHPRSGACTVASGMHLWLWTMSYFRRGAERRDQVIAELAESFCALIAARCQIVSAVEGTQQSSFPPAVRLDLCHVQAARAAGAVGTVCADLVHGYRRHPTWDANGCATCYGADELDEMEGVMPGIASSARAHGDVIEADGSHPAKAGPCVRVGELEGFTRLRAKLDGCLTGSRLAGDRAAAALINAISPAGPVLS